MRFLLTLLITTSMFSCNKKITTDGANNLKTSNSQTISCPIIEKPFVKKNGVPTGYSEYYLQRSIQDYFVKFCESSVTKKELEEALIKQQGLIKTLKLEIEIKSGEWDICKDDPSEMQSRIGEYAVIYKIID